MHLIPKIFHEKYLFETNTVRSLVMSAVINALHDIRQNAKHYETLIVCDRENNRARRIIKVT